MQRNFNASIRLSYITVLLPRPQAFLGQARCAWSSGTVSHQARHSLFSRCNGDWGVGTKQAVPYWPRAEILCSQLCLLPHLMQYNFCWSANTARKAPTLGTRLFQLRSVLIQFQTTSIDRMRLIDHFHSSRYSRTSAYGKLPLAGTRPRSRQLLY